MCPDYIMTWWRLCLFALELKPWFNHLPATAHCNSIVDQQFQENPLEFSLRPSDIGSEWLLKLLTLDTETGQLSIKENWNSNGLKVKGKMWMYIYFIFYVLAMIAYCFALGKSRKVNDTTYYKLTLLALLQNRFGNFSLINPLMAKVMT